jgi:hypothetical protein
LGEGGAGGVLVAYWGVALEGSCGRIMYEQPELHCRVRLHALFFAPSPGLTLGTSSFFFWWAFYPTTLLTSSCVCRAVCVIVCCSG